MNKNRRRSSDLKQNLTDDRRKWSAGLKTVCLCKTPLPYIALMHTLPLLYPTPCMPSPYSIPAHACPPLILSQPNEPMHDLPQFHPTSCMPSPYSISAHAHSAPILSQPMHTFPYFIQPYSILIYACPLPILSQPTQTTPVFCSIPIHACPPCHLHLECMFSF